jgi:hypothetical protein
VRDGPLRSCSLAFRRQYFYLLISAAKRMLPRCASPLWIPIRLRLADPFLQFHGHEVVLPPVLEDGFEGPGAEDDGVTQARFES